MYEEADPVLHRLLPARRPVLDILDADHTFLNEELAEHYGIPGVTGTDWRRVDGVKQYGRGGILGLATTLAKQSGAVAHQPDPARQLDQRGLAGRAIAAPAQGRAASPRRRRRPRA